MYYLYIANEIFIWFVTPKERRTPFASICTTSEEKQSGLHQPGVFVNRRFNYCQSISQETNLLVDVQRRMEYIHEHVE